MRYSLVTDDGGILVAGCRSYPLGTNPDKVLDAYKISMFSPDTSKDIDVQF